MTRVYRQLNELRQLREQTNDVTDNEQAAIVASLSENVLVSGDVVTFRQRRNESIVLTAGLYPGFTVDSEHAHVLGFPGSVINGLVQVASTCLLENLHFQSTGEISNALRLVQVDDGGLAVFKNCTFERRRDDVSSVLAADGYAHLAVTKGGKAKAFNCTFRSNLASGVMNGAGLFAWSDAANAVANLDVVSSYNPTTHTLQNGTATGVVT
tara:strand:- start:3727 stop:4359 length:633 start_codon:yes stop_codon:yes gene_type:complete